MAGEGRSGKVRGDQGQARRGGEARAERVRGPVAHLPLVLVGRRRRQAPGGREEPAREAHLGLRSTGRPRPNPSRVEGWFYASAGVGMYSLGISIVTALLDGMESKYIDRLKKAQAADPTYYDHGADVSWGRYWYELPWPKYDGEKSELALPQGAPQLAHATCGPRSTWPSCTSRRTTPPRPRSCSTRCWPPRSAPTTHPRNGAPRGWRARPSPRIRGELHGQGESHDGDAPGTSCRCSRSR